MKKKASGEQAQTQTQTDETTKKKKRGRKPAAAQPVVEAPAEPGGGAS